MKLNVLEDKKGEFVFELEGATHTVCNILKQEMWTDKHVKLAGYTIRHPLLGNPEFHVQTDGQDARKIVTNSCQKIQKNLTKLAAEIKKEVK